MIDAHITCILGQPGLRMDFIAGWLGTLPNFVQSNWYIDPVTRQSRATTSNVIDFRDEFDLDSFVSNCCNFMLDSNSNMSYATKAHQIHECHWKHVNSGSIKLVNVIPNSDINQNQVHWEFFLKTYGKFEYDGSWSIDRLISKQDIVDSDRIEKLHQLLSDKIHNIFRADYKDVDIPKLQYSSLFVPGGSVYLCDVLELSVDTDYHKFWDAMLPLAHTPSEVTLWGKKWQLQDYFN